jgi:hypothetical protein
MVETVFANAFYCTVENLTWKIRGFLEATTSTVHKTKIKINNILNSVSKKTQNFNE